MQARHEPELLHLIASVQPVTVGIPVGNDQAVPILPGPDRGNGEAQHPSSGSLMLKMGRPVSLIDLHYICPYWLPAGLRIGRCTG